MNIPHTRDALTSMLLILNRLEETTDKAEYGELLKDFDAFREALPQGWNE